MVELIESKCLVCYVVIIVKYMLVCGLGEIFCFFLLFLYNNS